MPELPEVETICRSLRDYVVGRTMAEVEIQLSRLIKWPTPEDFRSIMTGRTIEALERRGKYLLFQLSGDWVLVVHLRMTGRLYYRAADAEQFRRTRNLQLLREKNIMTEFLPNRQMTESTKKTRDRSFGNANKETNWLAVLTSPIPAKQPTLECRVDYPCSLSSP